MATEVMAPSAPCPASRISRPRSRAIRTAVAASKAPEACSAMTSPKLWPRERSGLRSKASASARWESVASASAGWAISVARSRSSCARASSSESAGSGNTTSWSGTSPASRAAASSASQGARAASKWMARSPAMPTRWLPWPGNRNAIRPGCASPSA